MMLFLLVEIAVGIVWPEARGVLLVLFALTLLGMILSARQPREGKHDWLLYDDEADGR